MNDYIKFAWRNIWRNKRRTLITTASIFFGVVLSAFMSSMQEGSYAQYIKTIVNSYSGYIQVHRKGYWNDKSINNLLEYSAVRPKIEQINGITIYSQRLENYALASTEEITKGVIVMGVAPQKEDSITHLSGKIIKGEYLHNGDDGVIVGSSLAKYLKVGVNDTLVLLSQGFHGVSAAGKYTVRGIIKQPSPELDRSVVYMDVANCQELFSAQDLLTYVVVMVRKTNDVPKVKETLSSQLGGNYEVMDWKEINRILLKQIDSDRASGILPGYATFQCFFFRNVLPTTEWVLYWPYAHLLINRQHRLFIHYPIICRTTGKGSYRILPFGIFEAEMEFLTNKFRRVQLSQQVILCIKKEGFLRKLETFFL